MRGIGFAVGMLMGAVAGLLAAPRRGSETRTRIRELGQELVDRAATPLQGLVASTQEWRAAHAPATHSPGPCEPTL